jgi:hypothetical protein
LNVTDGISMVAMGTRDGSMAWRLSCLLLGAGGCLVAPRALGQTIRYVAQDRRIAASNTEEYFVNDPLPDYVRRSDSKEAVAPDFGPFDAAVEASAGGNSRVSQHSVLAPNRIGVVGDWSNYAATDEGSFAFDTVADVTFDVVGAPVPFRLAYSLRDPSTRGFRRQVDLFLRPVDGAAGDVFRVTPQYDPDLYTAAGTASGALTPGRYQFRFLDSYFGDVGEFGGYDVQLSLGTVPEPATAGLVFVGAGVLLVRRRRR